jgi:hypothetical protein
MATGIDNFDKKGFDRDVRLKRGRNQSLSNDLITLL